MSSDPTPTELPTDEVDLGAEAQAEPVAESVGADEPVVESADVAEPVAESVGADEPVAESADVAEPVAAPTAGVAEVGRRVGGVQVGRIVTVTVATVQPGEIEVRLADGRTGVITRADLGDGPVPAVGSEIEAALLARDDAKHRVVLSRVWAQKQAAWQRVERAHAERTPISGRVTKVVKGGLVVDLGLRGFLPASLIDEHRVEDPSVYVGQDLEVLVTEVDRAADRIVVSRKDLLRQSRRRQERDSFARLEVGGRHTGRVVSVADYGAVVDLGGARGLVHRSELSWNRIEHPSQLVSVGDEVTVEVIEVNKGRKRVSLSMRRTAPDPLIGVEPGRVETATVTSVVEFGAFVRLESTGAEGLVHISELSDVPGFRPDQLVTPGEQVLVKVIEVDRKRRRIGMSVRQAILAEAPPTTNP